jgi:16S rRNA (guanine527-N7)-methyltransferase
VTLEKKLADGLRAMGLALPEPARAKLLEYLRLLAKWNRAYNLTAVQDPKEMIPRHLLDSLAVLPHLRGPRVLDIGTGAGLPGIPLALAAPALDFTLLDASAKKIRFVRQAVHVLGLANAHPVQARLEAFRPPEKFDTLIARAFAAIPVMLAQAAPLLRRAPPGQMLAMKGARVHEELAALPPGWHAEVVRLAVPGLEAVRYVVILKPA